MCVDDGYRCVCVSILFNFISPGHSPHFVLILPVLYTKHFLVFPPSLFPFCAALCQMNTSNLTRRKEKKQSSHPRNCPFVIDVSPSDISPIAGNSKKMDKTARVAENVLFLHQFALRL